MSILNHNLNNRPIGFFDSGVGGLSVYSKFRMRLPNENTLYFGDLAHLPYGNKSRDELIGYARSILNFYKDKQVKAVVIACNTSSAQAYDAIKNNYDFKIYPIIQSCASIIASYDIKKIGIFATPATVDSGVYTKELKKHNQNLLIKEIPCKDWVNIVESGQYADKSAVENIKRQLSEMLTFNPDKIILGCTHYPYLRPLLEKLVPGEIFIDPAEIFVKYIEKDLNKYHLLNSNNFSGKEEIFVSSKPENFMEHSKIFYNIKKVPSVCRL